jgi:hypothetical protein
MNFTKTKIVAALALTVAAAGAQAATVTSMTVQDLGTVWTGGSAHVAVNSGVGTHTVGTSGGTFYFRGSLFSDTSGSVPLAVADGANSQAGFDGGGIAATQFALSWGTTGAGITNGINQTSFGGAFDFGGANFTPNSNDCAGGTCVTGNPTGSVVGGNLAANTNATVTATNLAGFSIDLGDFAGFYDGVSANFRLNPNGTTPLLGNAILRTSALGGVAGSLAADQFYYSLDWTSTISSGTGDVSTGNTAFDTFTADWHLEGIATAPVPEASTYGMMLAGLGLVGFAVRRRNQA